jgi:hypothetical protein
MEEIDVTYKIALEFTPRGGKRVGMYASIVEHLCRTKPYTTVE